MEWLLGLQWESDPLVDDGDIMYDEPEYNLTPFVRMEINHEVAEKIGNVSIVSGKVTLFTHRSEKFITLSRQPITLSKNNDYQCNLISADESPMKVALSQLRAGKVEVEAEIIVVKSTFSIIEPVVVPPCPLLQNFSTLLAVSEDESKEKFCDMKITATQPASYVHSKPEATSQLDSYSEEVSDDQLVSDSKEDLDTPTQTDFYVHKAILASRSPVFAKMFSSDMLESATNSLTLPDIEPDVLKELLTYIYTGECPNIKEHALSLLGQAEKYELSHLKALCERRLSYDLQVSNAARILVLADTLKAEQLKRNALLFINEHGHEVQSTDGWEEVNKSIELLRNLFSTIHEPAAKKRKLM